MSAITTEEVARLAALARLDLAPDELEYLAGQLAVITEAVAVVSEAAGGNVPPTSHPIPLVNVFREDVVEPSLPQEVVLGQAPASEAGQFKVPRIMREEP
ncbi:MAG: Asp-tRNA(Asn)/Glu-tRNA(Gln) amidotransferase subunit GatC [Micrococcales bacterium]|nr:Asp-tRNA(Asn)/Glu-tRNA(Gln) amidotransferase subunit GatC [Micrococcales bacterium]